MSQIDTGFFRVRHSGGALAVAERQTPGSNLPAAKRTAYQSSAAPARARIFDLTSAQGMLPISTTPAFVCACHVCSRASCSSRVACGCCLSRKPPRARSLSSSRSLPAMQRFRLDRIIALGSLRRFAPAASLFAPMVCRASGAADQSAHRRSAARWRCSRRLRRGGARRLALRRWSPPPPSSPPPPPPVAWLDAPPRARPRRAAPRPARSAAAWLRL